MDEMGGENSAAGTRNFNWNWWIYYLWIMVGHENIGICSPCMCV